MCVTHVCVCVCVYDLCVTHACVCMTRVCFLCFLCNYSFSKTQFQNFFALYCLFSEIEKEGVGWGGWERGNIWEELGAGKY